MKTCTSEFIGLFDDLSELMKTPAKHNDYAFYVREAEPYEIAGEGIGDFYSMHDKYVYHEGTNSWEFEYTLAIHDEEKEIEYRIANLQKKLITYKIEKLKKQLEHLDKDILDKLKELEE